MIRQRRRRCDGRPHGAGERTFTGRCTTDKATDVFADPLDAHESTTIVELRFLRDGERSAAPQHTNRDGLNSTFTRFVDEPLHLEPGDAIEGFCTFVNRGETEIAKGDQGARREAMGQAIAIHMPDQEFRVRAIFPQNPERLFKPLTPPAEP